MRGRVHAETGNFSTAIDFPTSLISSPGTVHGVMVLLGWRGAGSGIRPGLPTFQRARRARVSSCAG